MAEEGTPVEIMARMEFESAGSVRVAEVEREAGEDGVEEACVVDEEAAEELTTGAVMFT